MTASQTTAPVHWQLNNTNNNLIKFRLASLFSVPDNFIAENDNNYLLTFLEEFNSKFWDLVVVGCLLSSTSKVDQSPFIHDRTDCFTVSQYPTSSLHHGKQDSINKLIHGNTLYGVWF